MNVQQEQIVNRQAEKQHPAENVRPNIYGFVGQPKSARTIGILDLSKNIMYDYIW